MRFFTVLTISFLMAAAPAHGDETLSPVEIMALREDAERAYDERDAETAIALFNKLTDLQPEDADSWYGLSRAYEWNEQYIEAAQAAERVQDIGFVYDSYMAYRLAGLNARAGREDLALQWLAKSLELGYRDRPGIATDADFSGIAENPQFIELSGALEGANLSRDAGLQADLDYLVDEAQRLHAGLDRTAYSAEFLQAANELRQEIPELDDAQVFAGFMLLLASLNDGHTGLYGPDPDSPLKINSKILPLKFYWFAEGIYVVDAASSAKGLTGQRVIKFGDLSAEQVLQRLSVYRGVDNSMTWQWMGPQFFLGRIQMLQLVGATASPDYVELTLQDSAGNTTVERVVGGDFNMQRKLRPSPAAVGDTPIYLSRVNDAFWLQALPQRDAIYFQFNQVRNADDESIEDFAARLAGVLTDTKPTSLIVDMRHNNGGNNTLVQPLVKTLIAFEQASSDNTIYVITGRNTFSAAQNFINRVEQWTDAVFVGEPSASSPNFVGEETTLLLPYSRVRGSISNRYWQDSQPYDQRAWITPALLVPPTAADYFAGRDAALEAVLEVVGDKQDR